MNAWMFVEHPAAFSIAWCCFVALALCLLNLFAGNYAQFMAVETCLVPCTGFSSTKKPKSLAESRSIYLLNKHIRQLKAKGATIFRIPE
jgi:hypothetical protein